MPAPATARTKRATAWALRHGWKVVLTSLIPAFFSESGHFEENFTDRRAVRLDRDQAAGYAVVKAAQPCAPIQPGPDPDQRKI